MPQFRAIVHGRVQGVCFRAATVEAAAQLGLLGHTRNLPDGCVEVVAAGEACALQKLIEFLHQGPSLASVSEVELDRDDRTPVAERFDIQY